MPSAYAILITHAAFGLFLRSMATGLLALSNFLVRKRGGYLNATCGATCLVYHTRYVRERRWSNKCQPRGGNKDCPYLQRFGGIASVRSGRREPGAGVVCLVNYTHPQHGSRWMAVTRSSIPVPVRFTRTYTNPEEFCLRSWVSRSEGRRRSGKGYSSLESLGRPTDPRMGTG